MFVTVVAVLCLSTGLCVEEIVTDSNLEPTLSFSSCLSGAQAPLAKWKGEHPVYRSAAYRIEKYRCVPGHYEIRGRV
jgi:hypothetical protein